MSFPERIFLTPISKEPILPNVSDAVIHKRENNLKENSDNVFGYMDDVKDEPDSEETSFESCDEEPFSEWAKTHINFARFPDPVNFLAIHHYGLTTPERFVAWWLERFPEQHITGFVSYDGVKYS